MQRPPRVFSTRFLSSTELSPDRREKPAHNAGGCAEKCAYDRFSQDAVIEAPTTKPVGSILMTLDTRIARSLSAGIVNFGPGARGARGIFRKEGEYWTVGYKRKDSRLKDSKGLGYLAHLLRHPGVEFHVLDLLGGIAGRRDDDDAHTSTHDLPRRDEDLANEGMHITGLGDAGEMLDDQAKAAYRRRL